MNLNDAVRRELDAMSREDLVRYMEGERGFACYDTESKDDLVNSILVDKTELDAFAERFNIA